jgi:AbrB family looped-hinge helix DNA binding protein
MGRSLATVNAEGKITLPAQARRALGLEDGSLLEVRIDGEEIRLRPVRPVAADAWAYTAESLRSIKRSIRDIKAGRVYQLSTDEIAHSRRKRSMTKER